MNQERLSDNPELQGLTRLQQDLQTRDQLVDQLSQELYRMIACHGEWFNPAATSAAPGHFSLPLLPPAQSQTLQTLQQQLQNLETQIGFYQEQISRRDQEIMQLRESVQEIGDRNQMLEKVVQELPEVYRSKFSERLAQFKSKLETLQRENQFLQSQLKFQLQSQSALPNSAALAVRPAGEPSSLSSATPQIELPNFTQLPGNSQPQLPYQSTKFA